MIEKLANWYRTKTVREQRLLLLAAGLAVVVLSWLAVVRPVGLALERTKERHDRAVIERAQAEALVQDIAAARGAAGSQVQGSIRDIMDGEMARVGFDVAQTSSVGTDGARISISAVRPQTFFAWVSDLELRLGLDIEALTVRPNADETLAIDVTIRGGR